MFCISLISDKASPCVGPIKKFMITGWAAPVGMCPKHLKEYMTENKLPEPHTTQLPTHKKEAQLNKDREGK